MLKSRKSFFLFKFKFVFLNHKYLVFTKIELKKNGIHYFLLKSTDLIYLFNKNIFVNFFKFNSYLYYFNNFLDIINNINNFNDILFLSYSGYFLNNNYIKNINNYYLYYSNNYKLYTSLIYKPSIIWINIIRVYYFKLLKLLITLKSTNKIYI